jgi:hypothetical protein
MRRALLPFLLALIPFAFLVARFDFVCDDAFITFRYAQNLAEGNGPRYNLGAGAPVEGYTDFAWVLWMALFERLGLDPVAWSRATSVVCGALLLFAVVRSAERHFGPKAAFGAGLFLALQPTFGVWATGGLGTMPFALAIFLLHEQLLSDAERPRGVRAGALALLTALSRADGLFWVVVVLALGLATARARSSRRLGRAVGVAAAIVAVGVGAHVLWRLSYYGDFAPNTARAKIAIGALSLERGARYLASYWATVPATLVVFLVGAWHAARRQEDASSPLLRGATVVAGATFGYGVLVGGDFMTMGRFYLPALGFLALLFGALVSRLGALRYGLSVAGAVLLSLPAAFDRHVVPRPVREALHFRWSQPYETEYAMWAGMKQRAEEWTRLGRAIALHTEPGDSVVLSAIGAAGYYSRRFVFDRHGLVSRAVTLTPESAPPGRRSPGHDRQVFWTFFADENPTYSNASFHTAANPPPSGGREASRVVPLDVADGFPAGSALVLRLAQR